MERIAVEEILVIHRPDGTTIQLAGTKSDVSVLCEIMNLIPKELRGDGWRHELEMDASYVNSEGKEIMRVPNGNAVYVPDARKPNQSKG